MEHEFALVVTWAASYCLASSHGRRRVHRPLVGFTVRLTSSSRPAQILRNVAGDDWHLRHTIGGLIVIAATARRLEPHRGHDDYDVVVARQNLGYDLFPLALRALPDGSCCALAGPLLANMQGSGPGAAGREPKPSWGPRIQRPRRAHIRKGSGVVPRFGLHFHGASARNGSGLATVYGYVVGPGP